MFVYGIGLIGKGKGGCVGFVDMVGCNVVIDNGVVFVCVLVGLVDILGKVGYCMFVLGELVIKGGNILYW